MDILQPQNNNIRTMGRTGDKYKNTGTTELENRNIGKWNGQATVFCQIKSLITY